MWNSQIDLLFFPVQFRVLQLFIHCPIPSLPCSVFQSPKLKFSQIAKVIHETQFLLNFSFSSECEFWTWFFSFFFVGFRGSFPGIFNRYIFSLCVRGMIVALVLICSRCLILLEYVTFYWILRLWICTYMGLFFMYSVFGVFS